MSNEKKQIEDMVKVLKDYTAKNHIMASHIILECYAEELYKAGFKRQSEAKQSEGEWIISSDGYYPYCSRCKNEPKNGVMTDYCPNCGAKMKGGEGDA